MKPINLQHKKKAIWWNFSVLSTKSTYNPSSQPKNQISMRSNSSQTLKRTRKVSIFRIKSSTKHTFRNALETLDLRTKLGRWAAIRQDLELRSVKLREIEAYRSAVAASMDRNRCSSRFQFLLFWIYNEYEMNENRIKGERWNGNPNPVSINENYL